MDRPRIPDPRPAVRSLPESPRCPDPLEILENVTRVPRIDSAVLPLADDTRQGNIIRLLTGARYDRVSGFVLRADKRRIELFHRERLVHADIFRHVRRCMIGSFRGQHSTGR